MRLLTSLIVGALAALALSACQKSGGDISAADMSMGNPKAKVTMIEYASVACPHCARMNNEVFPAFKAKYIDTGRVHYIFREFLVGDPAEASLAAAGFLMARCAGKDKYFQVTDAIFHSLETMESPGGQPHAVLLNIAKSAGLTEPQFETCIRDDKSLLALQTRVDNYSKVDHIHSTPTFIINGKHFEGEMPMEKLDAAVAQAEAQAAKPAS